MLILKRINQLSRQILVQTGQTQTLNQYQLTRNPLPPLEYKINGAKKPAPLKVRPSGKKQDQYDAEMIDSTEEQENIQQYTDEKDAYDDAKKNYHQDKQLHDAAKQAYNDYDVKYKAALAQATDYKKML